MSSMNSRQFLKVTGTTLVGSSLGLMGFSPGEALAQVRQYKLARSTETRQTCTYCSVACGILMYSLGDGAKNARKEIFHIEGDRSEEHTSELQSLMRISYAVFSLKNKNK